MRVTAIIEIEYDDGSASRAEQADAVEDDNSGAALGGVIGAALAGCLCPRPLEVLAHAVDTIRDDMRNPLNRQIGRAEDAMIEAAMAVVDAWGKLDGGEL